ncbi:MAG: phosphatidylglycerophosphatase A [Saprospiraceae bacterium]|nr:phosphatidylglycerophosphatase A [Saprospiraceae bacterium]
MKRFYKLLLSGFGAGWLPIAPGTWGAAVAALAAWPLALLAPAHATLVLTVLIISCTWIGARGSHLLANEWGEDPKQTVIDEMVGMWITILGFPLHWPILLAGFLLFRIFDILKPFGVRRLEDIGGGWGVMLDDVMAGVYANLLLQIGCLVIAAF